MCVFREQGGAALHAQKCGETASKCASAFSCVLGLIDPCGGGQGGVLEAQINTCYGIHRTGVAGAVITLIIAENG
jgi:hypothetical protein